MHTYNKPNADPLLNTQKRTKEKHNNHPLVFRYHDYCFINLTGLKQIHLCSGRTSVSIRANILTGLKQIHLCSGRKCVQYVATQLVFQPGLDRVHPGS